MWRTPEPILNCRKQALIMWELASGTVWLQHLCPYRDRLSVGLFDPWYQPGKNGRPGKFAKLSPMRDKKICDIIKALALGATMWMCGGLLIRHLNPPETPSPTKNLKGYTVPGDQVDQYSDEVQTAFKMGSVFYKKFRGRVPRRCRHTWNELRSSEGVPDGAGGIYPFGMGWEFYRLPGLCNVLHR